MNTKTICAGDHIWVQRFGFTHHGIASGPDSVIHYLDKGEIAETSLHDFAEGSTVHVTDHPNRRHGRSESVRRARQRIGETEYNLALNNCEHLVTWCIDGDPSSEQVESALQRSGEVLAGALVAHGYAQKAETIRHAVSIAQAATTVRHSVSAGNIISGVASSGAAAGLIAGGTVAAGVVAAPVAVPVAIGVAAVAGMWTALFD